MVTLTGNEIVLVDGVDGNGRPCGVLEAVTTQQIANLGGGTGGSSLRIVTGTSPVTLSPNDITIEIAQTVATAVTVNLPTVPNLGQRQTVIDGNGVASNPATRITLVPPSGNIKGQATYQLNSAYEAVTFYWNGTNFMVV